jgi:hypothetical protein
VKNEILYFPNEMCNMVIALEVGEFYFKGDKIKSIVFEEITIQINS